MTDSNLAFLIAGVLVVVIGILLLALSSVAVWVPAVVLAIGALIAVGSIGLGINGWRVSRSRV
jgi:hypothetical protein